MLEDRVPKSGGVQTKLNKLTQHPAYGATPQPEVSKRKLVLTDALACVPNIYHELQKHAHGSSGIIGLDHRHFTSNELAALVSLSWLQGKWDDALTWEGVCLEGDAAAVG